MIQSWKGNEAQAIAEGRPIRSMSTDVAKAARRRLDQLNAVANVEEMRSPPGNRLHQVDGRWSVSVNMQYRLTFVWTDMGPAEVWFGDYH